MAVFRIEKNKDYTVMSNHHLRNQSLSLKAKGLQSLFLSLPEQWDYSLKGLAKICKEGVDCIGATLQELEAHGYLTRRQIRDSKGKYLDLEYTIHEIPVQPGDCPRITPSHIQVSRKRITRNRKTPIRINPIRASRIRETPHN